ncbi:MAG TPA: S8 family peptidase [Terriglobia bacterium]|nr:S8 family peptidase [Terriglobia bacterium]
MKHEKVAPGLMCAMQDYGERGRDALMSRGSDMGIMSLSGVQKEPKIVVFFRCRNQDKFDDLSAQGIVVNEIQGTVRTAYLTLPQIETLSEHPAVRRISPTRSALPLLDVAEPFVKLPEFRNRTGLNGKGVIVGIVDSGIDPKHPAFAGRILQIWDQTIPGPGVAEGGFGLELRGPELTASRDKNGHGTHVAGIAAGNDTNLAGIASAADIVFVKTDFNTGHIAQAIKYIFRVAGKLDRPAVVNLSLGSHFDAHDGSDNLSTVIDEESGPGRIVCCAAGNEGDQNMHASATIEAEASKRIRFSVAAQSPGVVLNGWYSGKDKFEIQVESPGGVHTDLQGIIEEGEHARAAQLDDSFAVISTPGPSVVNGDHHFEVQLVGVTGQAPEAGNWKLMVRGTDVQNGRLDVWVTDFKSGTTCQFLDNVSEEMKIGSPGASTQAITIGSFTTRSKWTDIDGTPRRRSFTLDDISPFSSPGPLRNQSLKPDVAAPGAVIASALSADSDPGRDLILSKTMRMDAGTSMASPFVAGLVALLLQREPKLTPEEIKKKLKAAAKIPNRPLNSFSNEWGFGLVDASLL